MSLCKASIILIPALAACALAQTPQNPLDGLTSDEYWVVYDVLQAAGHLPEKTHFSSVLLREPPKGQVLVWTPGKPFSREADVTLVHEGHSYAALVDISGRKVESWKEVQSGFAAAYQGGFQELGENVKQDPKIIEVLKKRGITDLNFVDCTPLPAGFLGMPEQDGRRIYWAAAPAVAA